MDIQQKAYGSWSSEITAEAVALKGVRLGHMQVTDERVYWLESRPSEKGRGVIVSCDLQGANKQDETPESYSVRAKTHEMGGGDFIVFADKIYFTNAEDQQIYCQSGEDVSALTTISVTEPSDKQTSTRYSDYSISPDGRWLIVVRETHNNDSVVNELVAINTTGNGEVKTLHSGFDFYSFPRISPNGHRLCFTCWNHPNMPWQGTELWLADFGFDGEASAVHYVAGGENESIYQPSWSPSGVLHFVSDRSGYWNIYSLRDGILNALSPIAREFGYPQWIFGTNSYCFGEEEKVYASFFENGQQILCEICFDNGHFQTYEMDITSFDGYLYYQNESLYFLGSGAKKSGGLYCYNISDGEVLALSASSIQLADEDISEALSFHFESKDEREVHGFYYPPKQAGVEGLAGEKPPLIVMSHGGPTGSTSSGFSLAIQFWTHRGFAVVDVNYSGSTGFGKEYQQRLEEEWGVIDVEDCVYAARFLVEKGLADGERLLIRGGSAGGFTTLNALVHFDDFAAGMSRYGVADLESLAADTHKFEKHYTDSLVGPLPEAQELYKERSPIHHLDKLSCPILILQGSEDFIVPPSQAEQMVAVLKQKQLPYSYILFEGEGHGFRQKENIIAALNSELGFYRQILAIESEEKIPLVAIENSQ